MYVLVCEVQGTFMPDSVRSWEYIYTAWPVKDREYLDHLACALHGTYIPDSLSILVIHFENCMSPIYKILTLESPPMDTKRMKDCAERNIVPWENSKLIVQVSPTYTPLCHRQCPWEDARKPVCLIDVFSPLKSRGHRKEINNSNTPNAATETPNTIGRQPWIDSGIMRWIWLKTTGLQNSDWSCVLYFGGDGLCLRYT